MPKLLPLAFALVAAPALADTGHTLDTHILSGHAKLVAATADLAASAKEDCSVDALKPAFSKAYDAWISISHI